MRLTLSLFIALCSVVAAAQTPAQAPAIYRSLMPDGHIVFGDKPAPGAKESKPLVVRPSNISTPGPSSAPNPTATGGAATGGTAGRQQNIDTANSDLNEARQNLERVKGVLESNREPKAEERIGTKTGVRTTDTYDQRIKALEQDVVTAQRQLDAAQARRNELR